MKDSKSVTLKVYICKDFLKYLYKLISIKQRRLKGKIWSLLLDNKAISQKQECCCSEYIIFKTTAQLCGRDIVFIQHFNKQRS